MTANRTLIEPTRINHELVARVLAERRRLGIGESFHRLPWWRPRGAGGRFVGRAR